MLTADVRRAAWDAAQDAAAAGELPAVPASPPGHPADPSTLRPVPPSHGGGPGHYSSTLAFIIAHPPDKSADTIAHALATRLTRHSWIAAATATGGFLTVAVTADALARLAVRIPQAADPARSDILRGLTRPPAPPTPQAPHLPLQAEVTIKLARTAGADIDPDFDAERASPLQPPGPQPLGPQLRGPQQPPGPQSPGPQPPGPQPGGPQPPGLGPPSHLDAALAFAGADAVRYALLTLPPGRPDLTVAQVPVKYHLGNPVYAVQYAHAHAVATLRQAADLGLGAGDAAGFAPRLLAHPCERALLGAMSWLPERVAWAARRGRPGDLARYLEELAGAYHDCREHCPALPFGGHAAPRDEDTTRARLWLVTAARVTVAAGLDLLGISAPDRL